MGNKHLPHGKESIPCESHRKKNHTCNILNLRLNRKAYYPTLIELASICSVWMRREPYFYLFRLNNELKYLKRTYCAIRALLHREARMVSPVMRAARSARLVEWPPSLPTPRPRISKVVPSPNRARRGYGEIKVLNSPILICPLKCLWMGEKGLKFMSDSFIVCFFAAERLQHSPKYGVFCRAEKTMEIRVFTTK